MANVVLGVDDTDVRNAIRVCHLTNVVGATFGDLSVFLEPTPISVVWVTVLARLDPDYDEHFSYICGAREWQGNASHFVILRVNP